MPSAQPRALPALQALRAAAALAVAVLHITQQAGAVTGHPGEPAYGWLRPLPWDAGVDVFFVISGFVMVWSSARAFARPGAARTFLARRIARIVPLYWALTSALVLGALLRPSLLSEGLDGAWSYVAASYAFLPVRRPDGFIQPVFRLGWTLNYEMLFYAIFAAFMFLPARRAIPAIVAAIVALAATGRVLAPGAAAPAFWTDPIVLEFAYGVLLGTAALAGARMPRAARAGLAALALAMLALSDHATLPRPLAWGIPAALLVAAATFGASTSRSPAMRAAVLLGDASYALYLVHPFPMRAVFVLLPPAPTPLGVLAYVALCTALSIALALALHRWLEVPATAAARRLLRA
jgi:peptidoglycan/LPS O-acetylase OafA/YrhL